ncbi:hypothetical protein SKAU_G00202790 [Synaphobranchus kaupii]|uniref:IgGFc-binding protein-like n=1 Tax=Synaphobranchus kaupii TaxID=118154 RepID=A0A9Q1FG63_SYNKA|nr:hypothetical protein SKAU_G00202790 [Synaphobranchus kaupii]
MLPMYTIIEGSYLLRENSLLNPFGLSRLESEPLDLPDVGCLEFWYRAPGSNGTDLRVLIKDDEAETEIWTSQATADRSWQQVVIPLSNAKNGIQVVFEADLGLPEDGDVTIDNVAVHKGPCGEQCAQGEFWADDACTTQCACSAPGGQLTCSPASCSEDHTCMSSGGAPVCLPNTSGTCSFDSEPHVRTFDGASYSFAEPCNYVLAQVCTDPAPVPFFRVEAQNEQRGDSASYIQQVSVDLQGLTVSLLKREAHKVMVNGIWRSLPLSLNNGAVKISSAGVTVILETDFELMVSYDATSGVQVKVPALYADQVCGLCGNFNRLSEDDYAKPDGSRATDTAELGQSWQGAGDTCAAPGQTHRCPLAEEAKYESESNCGVILSKESPFAGCSSAIAAEAFFRSCVFDMCAAGGDPQALCEALQTFATACQSAGITLPPWRNSTVCPLVCQANSHYNDCASGCPTTCSDQDTPMSCGVCEERCDCDPGFLLSGGKCVPAEDCGCWINGQHVERGATVMEGDCETQCQCMGQGTVECSPVSCGQGEVCGVKDGAVGCLASSVATCHVFGDPHYLTYNGKLYNFQGACNYTLAKTCGNGTVQFTVTGRNENRGNPAWSALNSVALEVQGLHLALRKNKEVYVSADLLLV